MSGEGSVFRRASDGKWIAQLSIGPRTNRHFRSRSASTRAEAIRLLDELKAERRANVVGTRTTVGAYLERWVNDARNIRPSTRRGYQAVVTYHLAPILGDVRLADLSPLHVEHALTTLAPRMSPKSLRNVHAVLRRALGQAVRGGMLSRNVADRQFVDAPHVPDADIRAMSVDEASRMLEAARGDPLEALFVLALDTGLRQGELLGLAWEDFEGDRVVVRKELTRIGGTYQRSEPKTPRSKRIVPLTPRAREALAEHRDRVCSAGYVPIATGPVFTNRRGGPLSGSWVTHHFYAILERAEVERLPFKVLRATFSSWLMDAGVADVTIAELMGHTRTHTTKRHYIATTPEQAVAAIARISHADSHGPSERVARRASE